MLTKQIAVINTKRLDEAVKVILPRLSHRFWLIIIQLNSVPNSFISIHCNFLKYKRHKHMSHALSLLFDQRSPAVISRSDLQLDIYIIYWTTEDPDTQTFLRNSMFLDPCLNTPNAVRCKTSLSASLGRKWRTLIQQWCVQLNESERQIYIMLQKILFQINAVLQNFLFVKES